MKKRVAALLMTALMGTFCITGCGSSEETVQSSETTATQEAAVETQDTEENTEAPEEVSSENAAILVVSFGTSYNDSRDITIGAVEAAIAKAFPEYEVRRAFTSQIIIDVLKERDDLVIDNVEEALDRAVEDGIKVLVVQPTHLMNGYEYTDLADALKSYEDKFDQIVLGEPLLTSDADYDAVIKAITEKTASYDDGETAIVFMGHGTEADSNGVYATLQNKLTDAGYENYYIGTVEAEPSIDDIVAALEEKGAYKKVVLEPLMLVAGDHANNDMAGDEEDSWKTILTGKGYEVECLIEGLGQIPSIQDVYVEHTQEAIDRLAN
ncbi:MAG: sirohydrochlorin cobaltochelatase [Lachnospiraceae bacterium]|nr:sirohydrochlorin cobaltochelatase [Lachnospiraceae bacterium]